MPTFGDLGDRPLEGRPIKLEPGGPPVIKIAGVPIPLDPGMRALETRRDVRIEAPEPVIAYGVDDNFSYVPDNDYRVYVESTVVILCKSAEQANKVAEQAMLIDMKGLGGTTRQIRSLKP